MREKTICMIAFLIPALFLLSPRILDAHDEAWSAWKYGMSKRDSCLYTETSPGVFVFDGNTKDCDYSPAKADNVRVILNAHYHYDWEAKYHPGLTHYFEAEEYGLYLTDETKVQTVPNLSKKRKSCRRTRLEEDYREFFFDVSNDFLRDGTTYYVEVEYLNDDGGEFLIDVGTPVLPAWSTVHDIAIPHNDLWLKVVRPFHVPAGAATVSVQVRLEGTSDRDLYVRSVAIYAYDPENPDPDDMIDPITEKDNIHFEFDSHDAAQTEQCFGLTVRIIRNDNGTINSRYEVPAGTRFIIGKSGVILDGDGKPVGSARPGSVRR